MGRKPDTKKHKLKELSLYLKGKSHYKFAKAIQVSTTHLSHLLSGKRRASLIVVNRINQETDSEITIKELRKDLFDEVMKCAEKRDEP